MATETLVCERCNSSWQRPVKRGRKPKHCGDCTSVNFPCKYCSDGFDTERGLRIHLGKSHANLNGAEADNRSEACKSKLHLMCGYLGDRTEHPVYLSCNCKCHKEYDDS